MAAKPAELAELRELIDGARAGLPLEPKVRDALAIWLERLEEWNARVDLTAARSPRELVDLMVADAFALSPHLPDGARLIDVGAGAGAPGLALALARDDLRVTLVEPRGKRASFLRMVLGAAGRADVAVERTRGESLAGRAAWDVAISRATLPPPAWLELGTSLVAPGGVVWVLLAKEPPPGHPGAVVDADVAYTWPLTGARRRAVRYRVQAP